MPDGSGVTAATLEKIIRRNQIVLSWAQIAVALIPIVFTLAGGATAVVVRLSSVETLLHELKGRQEAANESVIRFEERFSTMRADLDRIKADLDSLQKQMSFRRSDLAILAAYHRDAPLSDDLKHGREGSPE